MDEPKILVQQEEKEDKDYFVELNGNAKEMLRMTRCFIRSLLSVTPPGIAITFQKMISQEFELYWLSKEEELKGEEIQ